MIIRSGRSCLVASVHRTTIKNFHVPWPNNIIDCKTTGGTVVKMVTRIDAAEVKEI